MADPVRTPRSTEAATRLLEQFAGLEAQIAAIETERQAAIATVNGRADTAANDLIGRRDAIQAKLEPWWAKAGQALTAKIPGGKRKSIELGGCLIGTRASKASLAIAGNASDLIGKLQGLRSSWARRLLRTTVTLDKRAILAELDGKNAETLETMGFARNAPEAQFFVQRAEQTGTLAG